MVVCGNPFEPEGLPGPWEKREWKELMSIE